MKGSVLSAGLVLVLASIGGVEGHIAMWNKGLFGYNYPGQAGDSKQYYNGNAVVAPLRKFDNLTESDWFAHGMKAYPPVAGDFMELVSGSNYTAELACNRAWTSMRDPSETKKLNTYACPEVGPMHTMNQLGKPPALKWLGGTAIAIAYTSDEQAVKPNDFTVISVNYTSVWYRETVYQIPQGMPECPKGGCLCTWNWYHLSGNGEGYGNEFYNTLYRCTVTGATSSRNSIPLGAAHLPQLCPTNQTCNAGPKMPMYTFLDSGMNIIPDPPKNPTYNARYGFSDGAQTDIFTVSADSGGFKLLPSVLASALAVLLVVLASSIF